MVYHYALNFALRMVTLWLLSLLVPLWSSVVVESIARLLSFRSCKYPWRFYAWGQVSRAYSSFIGNARSV